jgi:hypothetical protein
MVRLHPVPKTPPDLSGVYLKLDRAKKHMETVRRQTDAFVERDPKPLDFRAKKTAGPSKSLKYVLRANIREEPPRELGLPIGDAVQNIRNALEYFAYELASPARRKRGTTTFPIYEDRCRFEVLGAPRIEGLTGDERTLIERFQPYNTGHPPPCNDPLAILHRLAIQDKHRVLLPVVAAIGELDSWIASTNADIRLDEFNVGRTKHDAVILAFTASPKDPTQEMYVDPRSALQIQVGDTGIIGFEMEANALLDMLYHHVRHTLLEWGYERGFIPPALAV